jgi:hypothetical protein
MYPITPNPLAKSYRSLEAISMRHVWGYLDEDRIQIFRNWLIARNLNESEASLSSRIKVKRANFKKSFKRKINTIIFRKEKTKRIIYKSNLNEIVEEPLKPVPQYKTFSDTICVPRLACDYHNSHLIMIASIFCNTSQKTEFRTSKI